MIRAAGGDGHGSFYFLTLFRTSYDQTLPLNMTAYRIDRAVELLQADDIPVREIAAPGGYTDATTTSHEGAQVVI